MARVAMLLVAMALVAGCASAKPSTTPEAPSLAGLAGTVSVADAAALWDAGAFVLDRVPAYDRYTVACEHPGFAGATVDSVAVTPGGATVLAPTLLTRLP